MDRMGSSLGKDEGVQVHLHLVNNKIGGCPFGCPLLSIGLVTDTKDTRSTRDFVAISQLVLSNDSAIEIGMANSASSSKSYW